MMNFVVKISAWFDTLINAITLKRKSVGHKNVKINGKIVVLGKKNTISIGEGTRINSSLLSNPIGGDTRCILKTINDGKIIIGKKCGISNSAIISQSCISIGDNTMIGGSCQIFDTDFHSIYIQDRIDNKGIKSAPIFIGKNVFIGTKCIILKGVTIGDGSVIAAGSVVTHDVPANQIWGGNPAVKLKQMDCQNL